MKKTMLVLMMVIVTSLLFSGCTDEEHKDSIPIKKPVKTIVIEENSHPVGLEYKGIVVPESKVNYAFKSSGRLSKLLVSNGDKIKNGDLLALLDTSDLQLELDSVTAQLAATKKDIDKATATQSYDKTLYEKMKILFEEGAIAKDELDQIKLKLDLSESTLEQAKEATETMQAKYNLVKNLMNDAKIVATSNGTVLATHFEAGELLSPGQPVITARSESIVVHVGLSQDDKAVVTKNTAVVVNDQDTTIEGKIIQIDDMPDNSTRTYLTKIRINNPQVDLGRIVDVRFHLGEKNGIGIPMESIMSDGETFIYIINNERAYKRIIAIEEISQFDVKVSGIEKGDEIVVDGMKRLSDGIAIEIVEQG
jgi:RND family efflux transporter MFP subunit